MAGRKGFIQLGDRVEQAEAALARPQQTNTRHSLVLAGLLPVWGPPAAIDRATCLPNLGATHLSSGSRDRSQVLPACTSYSITFTATTAPCQRPAQRQEAHGAVEAAGIGSGCGVQICSIMEHEATHASGNKSTSSLAVGRIDRSWASQGALTLEHTSEGTPAV